MALVVGGFPHLGEPSKCIFNLRAAQALGTVADVAVVHLRAWKPGRSLRRVSMYSGVTVTTVAMPQLPGERVVNILLSRAIGSRVLLPVLKDFDLIHSGDAWLGLTAGSWARSMGIPHVTQAIGSDVNSILPRLRMRREIAGWERDVQGVSCNSRALSAAICSLYPGLRNVRVIYRGVDLERFRPEGPAAGALADRSPVRFLFLGGMAPYPNLPHQSNTKGGETLMAAWQVAEKEPAFAHASLMLAGPASQSDRVARWHAGLRNPGQVYLAGTLPPESIATHIRAADAVLIPSMEEGLPNAALEASACGRAIVASEVGGVPEVVLPGETGLLLPPGAVAAWAQALAECAGQADRLRAMGRRARQHVEAHFDRRHYAPQTVSLYRAARCERLGAVR